MLKIPFLAPAFPGAYRSGMVGVQRKAAAEDAIPVAKVIRKEGSTRRADVVIRLQPSS